MYQKLANEILYSVLCLENQIYNSGCYAEDKILIRVDNLPVAFRTRVIVAKAQF